MPATFVVHPDKQDGKFQVDPKKHAKFQVQPKDVIAMGSTLPQNLHLFEATWNGLVNTVCQAYSDHLPLILRPDDIWSGIMVQLSQYLTRYAGEIRDKLVTHQGQMELKITDHASMHTADYPAILQRMKQLIATNIRDPNLIVWATPKFSTTTPVDESINVIALMASLQTFFKYKIHFKCGFPQVTLLGEEADWEELLGRIEMLTYFELPNQDYMTRWINLLRPVLTEFLKSFRGQVSVDWWDQVCIYSKPRSGPKLLSGWISVFCVFDEEGTWTDEASAFFNPGPWPVINTNKIPSGVCRVPVLIEEQGQMMPCTFTAGHVGMYSGDAVSLQPVSGWHLMLNRDQQSQSEPV